MSAPVQLPPGSQTTGGGGSLPPTQQQKKRLMFPLKKLGTDVKTFEALTISLSVLQVVLTIIPFITVIMEMRGRSSAGWRVASLVSLSLLLAASIAKLVATSVFWGKSHQLMAALPAILS